MKPAHETKDDSKQYDPNPAEVLESATSVEATKEARASEQCKTMGSGARGQNETGENECRNGPSDGLADTHRKTY